MLNKTMNNWWFCVHSDVLSARGNLFVRIQIFPNSWTLARGGGGSQSDRMFIASTKAALFWFDRNRGQRD
jgi:hypothetical protein